jgi:hypothetical protein
MSVRRRTSARAEARFLSSSIDLPIEAALAVQLGLGVDDYPVLERTTVTAPAAAGREHGTGPAGYPPTGWLLASGDRRQRVLLQPGMVVAEAVDDEDVGASLGKALASLAANGPVLHVQRLGLHHFTRLTSPDAADPTFWTDHMRPGFHGMLQAQHPVQLRWARLQAELRLDRWTVGLIQAGVDPDGVGGTAFLVSIALLRERVFKYRAGSFASAISLLGGQVWELSRQVLAGPGYPSPRGGRAASEVGGGVPSEGQPAALPDKGAADEGVLVTEVITIDHTGRPADPVSAILYLASVLAWPQHAVCRAVGVPRRTYYGWKTGGHRANPARITRLWSTVDAVHVVERTRPELLARIAQDQQASACLAAGDLTGFNNAVEEIARRSAPARGT